MDLKLFKSLWGMTESLEANVRRIAAAGYTGVETGIPTPDNADTFKALLKELKLEYIAMTFSGGHDGATHAESLKQQATAAQAFGPISITSHSAKDSMPYEEQKVYFRAALDIEQAAGLPINHETHRGRAMFNPWSTAALLKDFPELHLCSDFSHFCCVCESLLADQSDNLALCIERTRHVHGRVGHAEGPQVNDPRAPEWANAVQAHDEWWMQMARSMHKRGFKSMTFTPEFGPPDYMPTLPHTRQPLSDLWDVCLHVGKRFEQQFKETF